MVDEGALVALENGPPPRAPPGDVRSDFVAVFASLFERRPIWTALAIAEAISVEFPALAGELVRTPFFHALTCVAYGVRGGPYRGCWVRYGLNPLRDVALAAYQTIGISLRRWEHRPEVEKRYAHAARPSEAPIHALPPGVSRADCLPDRLVICYQLADLIHIGVVAEAVAQPKDRYTTAGGWFEPSLLNSIRGVVMLRMERLASGVPADTATADVHSFTQARALLREIIANRELGRPGAFDEELLLAARACLGLHDPESPETWKGMKRLTAKYCFFMSG
jgi:hypothetical protein